MKYQNLLLSMSVYGALVAAVTGSASASERENIKLPCGQTGGLSERIRDCDTTRGAFRLVTRNLDKNGKSREFWDFQAQNQRVFDGMGNLVNPGTHTVIWGPSDSGIPYGYTWKQADKFCNSLNKTYKNNSYGRYDGQPNQDFSDTNRSAYLGSLADESENSKIEWQAPGSSLVTDARGDSEDPILNSINSSNEAKFRFQYNRWEMSFWASDYNMAYRVGSAYYGSTRRIRNEDPSMYGHLYDANYDWKIMLVDISQRYPVRCVGVPKVE